MRVRVGEWCLRLHVHCSSLDIVCTIGLVSNGRAPARIEEQNRFVLKRAVPLFSDSFFPCEI